MRRETGEEFDQGRTRAWRANQATWHQLVVLDVAPSSRVIRPVRALRRSAGARWLAGGYLLGISPAVLGALAIIAAFGWDESLPVFVVASISGVWWLCMALWLLWFAFRR
jgi:hypothetical protein